VRAKFFYGISHQKTAQEDESSEASEAIEKDPLAKTALMLGFLL